MFLSFYQIRFIARLKIIMSVDSLIQQSLSDLAPKVRPGSKDFCQKSCKDCKALQDLPSIFRCIGEKTSLTRLAVHFLDVNGHEKTDTWKFTTALNLAFAASISAKN